MRRFFFHGGYFIAFLLLLGAELLIGRFVRDSLVRPYLGDVLAVPALYCLIRAFWRASPPLLPLWIVLFAALVEAGQYFRLAALLPLPQGALLRTVLGATFDTADLLCYAAGGGLLFLWQALVRNRRGGK